MVFDRQPFEIFLMPFLRYISTSENGDVSATPPRTILNRILLLVIADGRTKLNPDTKEKLIEVRRDI